MMKMLFTGDRGSRTIKIGKRLKKLFPKTVKIVMWDGYSSHIAITKKEQ